MKPQTQITGRRGELVLELELLKRGWAAVNTNASINNFVAWDILAIKNNRTIKIRVKAKREGETVFRWSAKSDNTILPNSLENDADDFVAAISFDESPRGYEVYLIPSNIVEHELRSSHQSWLLGKKERGQGKRKNTNIRNIYMDDKIDKISHGYAKKWEQYQEAWQILER